MITLLCRQNAVRFFERNSTPTYRSFGTRGSRGHGWLHHYRAGNGGRHLQGRYHNRDVEKRAAINDSMFDLGSLTCYLDLDMVESKVDGNDGDEEAGTSSTNNNGPRRIILELASTALPRTCDNFLKLIEDGYYDNTKVHRIEKNVGFCMGYTSPNGGRCHPDISPYGRFEHESYVISHVHKGMLTMLSPGVDKNDSRFCITTGDAPQLDGRLTAFGRVKGVNGDASSMQHLEDIVANVFTAKGKPQKDIDIVGCGVL